LSSTPSPEFKVLGVLSLVRRIPITECPRSSSPMAATAALSLACPLRRSSRLAHSHTHPTHAHSPSPPSLRQSYASKHHHHHRHRPRLPPPDPEPDPDSSSSDPENELTPRALRALKRQRLALDPDGIPLTPRHRPRKRRKENIAHGPLDVSTANKDPPQVCLSHSLIHATHPHTLSQHSKRPLSPPLSPLTPIRPRGADWWVALILPYSLYSPKCQLAYTGSFAIRAFHGPLEGPRSVRAHVVQ